jgi:nucleotide-binding universal stress UspA family protein
MNEHATARTGGAVVVGVDGSAGARAALRWAIAESRLRQAPVRAVHAWTPAYFSGGYAAMGGGYGFVAAGTGDYASELYEAAQETLERAIAETADEAEGVAIEREVVEGVAAQVLLEAAGAGDLLVVGSRGHGGLAGLLLGSVSQQCAHHARCPVVIVHPPMPSPGGAGSADAASFASA